MAPYVTAKVLPILKDTQTCWQPADYLPKPESETFLDEVSMHAFALAFALQPAASCRHSIDRPGLSHGAEHCGCGMRPHV